MSETLEEISTRFNNSSEGDKFNLLKANGVTEAEAHIYKKKGWTEIPNDVRNRLQYGERKTMEGAPKSEQPAARAATATEEEDAKVYKRAADSEKKRR